MIAEDEQAAIMKTGLKSAIGGECHSDDALQWNIIPAIRQTMAMRILPQKT